MFLNLRSGAGIIEFIKNVSVFIMPWQAPMGLCTNTQHPTPQMIV